jgi:hypothetical protein
MGWVNIMQKVINVLSEIEEKINENELLPDARKNYFFKKLSKLNRYYSELPNPDKYDNLGYSLITKGNDIVNELKKNKDVKNLTARIDFYIRYAQAAYYDLKGDKKSLQIYIKCFVFMAALLLGLSPQFFGFLSSIVFMIPVFLGLKGVRSRKRTGFIFTISVIPLAMLTGITWLRFCLFVALKDFAGTAASTATAWKVSASTAQLLIVVPSILSVALIVLCFVTAYLGYKYHEMFI